MRDVDREEYRAQRLAAVCFLGISAIFMIAAYFVDSELKLTATMIGMIFMACETEALTKLAQHIDRWRGNLVMGAIQSFWCIACIALFVLWVRATREHPDWYLGWMFCICYSLKLIWDVAKSWRSMSKRAV